MAGSLFARALASARRRAGEAARRVRVRLATHHISGPRRVTLAPDEVALVCLMKDAEYRLDHLIAHHRALGIRHFVLIDNGSTDRSLALAAAHPDVSVFRNTLPVRDYETLLRARIARQAVSGGWFLFLDTDELFVPAHGEGRPVSDVTGYCNRHGQDAVLCQVLDLFSDLPYSTTRTLPYPQAVAAFDRYSLGGIVAHDYHDPAIGFAWFLRTNRIDYPQIKVLFGGLRHEAFGEFPCLSTHRLVRNAAHIALYSHPHASGNVTLADFTGLIRHYKFTGDFLERERAQVAAAVWSHGEDARRVAALEGHDDFTIGCAAPRRYTGTPDLVRQGFLACSPRFLAAFPAPGAAACAPGGPTPRLAESDP